MTAPVSVKLLDPRARLPVYGSPDAAGADLYALTGGPVTIAPGETAFIPIGLAMEIPEGYGGFVYARSGLASKHGITLSNSVGVIDSGYRGEIGATLLNQSDETTTLDAGTRVCQLIVMPFVPCELVPCEELTETERGAAGFGSTGIA